MSLVNPAKSILMVSPYPHLSELARQISFEMDFNIVVEEKILEEGVKVAKEYERNGVECIISRGATGILIKNNVSVPVVMVNITAFDILNALFQARELGHKVAFFEYYKRKNNYDYLQILKILNTSSDEVEIFYYHNLESLRKQIDKASQWKAEVAVTTGQCSLKMFEERGIPNSVLVGSTREAIVDAFQRTIDIVSIRQKERQAAEFMNKIIDNVDTGIVVVDNNKRITHLNPVSEKLLSCKRETVIGQTTMQITDMLYPLKEFITLDPELTSQMLNIRDRKIYAHKIPLLMNDSNQQKLFGVIITLQEVGKIQKMEAKIRKELHTKGLVAQYSFEDIVGKSKAIKDTINRAKDYAKTGTTVLITGESGTGKELFAQSIHNASPRNQGPFVAFNCATIPENLLESELFGYSEGSFTGAIKGGKPGLFELSHGGTIFLDEISEMPMHLQTQLLRVLQEKTVRRVGDDKITPIDVRVIVSTNKELRDLIKENKFREDLYFRLNVLSLKLPPLRERKEDIFLLIKNYLRKANINSNYITALSTYQKWLEQYHWPGNIRELENFLEKYITLRNSNYDPVAILGELVEELYSFGKEYLSDDKLALADGRIVINIGTLEEMETEIINKIQKLYPSDNKSAIAQRLNVSRTTLWKKLKSKDGTFRGAAMSRKSQNTTSRYN